MRFIFLVLFSFAACTCGPKPKPPVEYGGKGCVELKCDDLGACSCK